MRQSEVFPYYRKCVEEMEKRYDTIRMMFSDDYVEELCKARGYVGDEQRNLIAQMELGSCVIEDVELLGDMRKELGLVSSKDNFLLNNRFVIRVDDMVGNLVALIGYYPDEKKYITTPSPFFSKECMFFNFKQAYELAWFEYGGLVFLVEGIFDCLSLRSLGLPAIATMGSSVSKLKGELLKFFKKVIAIPDNDKTGRKAINRYSKQGWKVPSNTTIVKFEGGLIDIGITKRVVKDMDNFVSWFDADDVRNTLLQFRDSKEDVEILRL